MKHESPRHSSELPGVLLVEDDARFRDRLARAFEDRGWKAFTAGDCEAAAVIAADQLLELAVVDLRLGAESGIEAVRSIRGADEETVILMLTGYGSIATAVAAMRMGAADYLTKPADADQLLTAYERVKAGVASGTGGVIGGAAGKEPQAAVPSLDQVEWEHIHRILADCDGNISRAAKLLGVHRRSLQRKLAKRPLPNP